MGIGGKPLPTPPPAMTASTFPATQIGVRIERERNWGLPSYRVTFENGDTLESLTARQIRELLQDR